MDTNPASLKSRENTQGQSSLSARARARCIACTHTDTVITVIQVLNLTRVHELYKVSRHTVRRRVNLKLGTEGIDFLGRHNK